MEELPERTYFGTEAKNAKSIKGLKRALCVDSVKTFPNEKEQSSERREQIEAMFLAVAEFGFSLKLNLNARLPFVESFHYLESRDFTEEMKKAEPGYMCVAFRRSDGTVGVEEKPILAETLASTNHELIHLISSSKWRVTRKENGVKVSDEVLVGYSNNKTGTFKSVTEALTEMTNVEVIDNFWKSQEELKGIPQARIGYAADLLFWDGVIEHVAKTRAEAGKKEMVTYQEVYKHLQKGMITGDFRHLNVLKETFGVGGMKALAHVKVTNVEEVGKYSQALGMKDLAKKVEDYQTNRTHIKFLNAIRPLQIS